jgi:hypothetical protein
MKNPLFPVPENFLPLGQRESQSQNNFSFGLETAAFPFFHPVDGQGGDPRFASQFGFAQEEFFAVAFQGIHVGAQPYVISEDLEIFPVWETPPSFARTIPQPEKIVNIFFH